MRVSFVVLAAAVVCAHSAFAQNPTIDLNQWTVEDLNGAGPWVIDAPRLYAHSTNTVNTDCSVLYSDFTASFLEFRMSVDPSGGDDDMIGFVVGWNPGDATNATADYLLVDWKRATQTYQDWGTAMEGLALSHVSGPLTRGYGGAPIDLWSHTLSCTELARGNTYGQQGWEFGTDYFFRVLYIPGNPGSIDVWVNGVPEFHATGAFNPGRFGCYNLSQSQMEFQFPLPGSVTAFGNGCAGSAGTPYLFGPEEPLAGERLPIVVANLPPMATAVVLLGLSNSTWQGAPLPIDLGPVGAAGCGILTSTDVILPATNFMGTAYTTLRIPASALPSSGPVFFAQGLALDPAANTLGVVLSNGVGVTIGIH